MDRATDTTGQLFACGNSLCAFEPRQLCTDCMYQHAANKRLALFEDLLDRTGLSLDELEALAQAKREGRVVMLPCRVGDTLYWVDYDEVYEARILSYHADGSAQYFEDDNGNEFTAAEYNDCLGKTVFLTREAAEAALGEGKGSENDV